MTFWGYQDHMWWWWCPWQLPCKGKTWKSGHVSLYFLRTILGKFLQRQNWELNNYKLNRTSSECMAQHLSTVCVAKFCPRLPGWLMTGHLLPCPLLPHKASSESTHANCILLPTMQLWFIWYIWIPNAKSREKREWKEVGYISCEGVMVIAGSESVKRSQSNGGITTNA